MTNYNQDNGSLFDEMLADPDESFLFGGGDLWHDPTTNDLDLAESFLGL